MRLEMLVPLTILGSLCFVMVLSAGAAGTKSDRPTFTIHPVGSVEIRNDEATLAIDGKYADALHGLKDFSHVWVFYWFDRNDTPEKRSTLSVRPRGNPKNPLTGVFATRSPARPNLIALTLCEILSVKGNRVRIDKIDALDGSPIIDLKPYIPRIDSRPDASVPGWVLR